MGINRVQFQKGLSIEEFMERYGTEEKCRVGGVAWRGVALADGFCLSGMWLRAP